MGDDPSGYSGWFEHWADAQPDAVAQIGDDGRVLTYADIEIAANRIANAIDDLDPEGAFPIVVVGVEQGVDAIISMVAVAKAGRTQLPLDPGDPPARLAEAIGRMPPAIVLLRHAQDPALSLVDPLRARLLHLEEIPDDAPAERRARSVEPEALCVVVFTSGTTGVPKAAGRSFAAIDEIKSREIEEWQRPGIRHALVADHQWLAGWATIRRVLCAGGTLVRYSTRQRGPGELARFLAEHRVQHLGAVPSLVRAMLDVDPVTPLPDLRWVTFTGDILHRELVMRLFDRLGPDARVETSYGASELGGVAKLTMDRDTVPEGDIVPVGVPHARVEVEIEDAGPDGLGRIVVVTRRGAPVGTDGARDESLEALPDGRFRHLTSDLGLIRPDGMLEIRGRRPHMAKVRGQRIGVSEVEGALLAVPGIRDAGVGVHPGDEAGRLTAWYVAAPGADLHVAELRRQLRPRLPSFMVPAAFVPMAELPRGTRGKLLRDQLPPPGSGRPDLGYAYEAPVGHVEEVIAHAYEQILDVTPVGRHDELYDLGGDSLNAAEVMTAIGAELGRDLPLSVFVEAGTPAELVERLGREPASTNHSRLVDLQPAGEQPPVYCIHGGGGQVLSLAPLSERFGRDRPFIGIQMRQSDKPRALFRVNHLAERYAREIAARQGTAPCIVAGHSYGGVVAQEVSRRLVERGIPVELCILLDTMIPRRRLVAGRRRRARALGPAADTVSTAKELLYAVHAAVGLAPKPHRLTTERMVAALWGMSWHRVRTTPVPIVVVQAADAPTHHDLGQWQAHTSARCTRLASAGGHNSMLGSPYVDELAAVLAEQLARVEVVV